MRWVKRISVGLLVLVLVFGLYALWTVRRSFPTVDGELEVSGLRDTVEVVRDDWGVPHIFARNDHDLFFAQGYTHAQERFWQMDFWRHIGSARLSEMFGESQLDTDRFLRSLGFVELANQELELLDDDVRNVVEWYADGVNAYLAENDGAEVSLEYAILPLQNPSYEIEPWTPVNTLTWARMMSWDLSANMSSEIARAVLSRGLPRERVDQLYPPYPEERPVIVASDRTSASSPPPELPDEAMTALRSAADGARSVWDLTGGGFEGIGSNNWAIGGELTESGLPLLANDTHLGIQIPSIWFENGLHCVGDEADCTYKVVGFSFAGTPGVVIGHNERIAWGVTNQATDAQDLYIERINPDDPGQYEVDGEWVDFQTRTETIAVAGGEDVEFEVRSTRHGPVISGTYLDEDELDGAGGIELPEQYAVALAWQTLEPSTLVEAILGLNTAEGYEDFREAASKWDIAPQNLIYADVEGNIAHQATGEIPVRANGDGLWPVPGWTSDHEWVGTVPFEEMPRLFNPPQGYIVTANQPVLRAGSEPFIGIEGSYGYRADRIGEMILELQPHDVESSQRMQFDTRDEGAEILTPFLLGVGGADDESVALVQDRVEAWSRGDRAFMADGESTGAGVYQAVWRHVLGNTFQDELPEDYWPVGGSRWFEIVEDLLSNPDDRWWDNVTTERVETRDDVLVDSMADAHDELSDLVGDDPSDWAWGRIHIAHFENQTLGKSGIGPIEWLFNRTAPQVLGGSSAIVNAVGWDTDKSFLVDWVPSQRMVVDLSDFSASTFVHTTGQSGHAFHEFYDNMIEAWALGDHGPMHWERSDVDVEASSTLTMVPPG